MHPFLPEPHPVPAGSPALAIVLREARRLQRLAQSDALSSALPPLRRLMAAGVLRGTGLPQAFRTRDRLQRKHFLRLLALEAGHPSWEAYRPTLEHVPPAALAAFALLERGWGQTHQWFASESQARAHVAQAGGCVLRIGQQAVALTAQQARAYGMAEVPHA